MGRIFNRIAEAIEREAYLVSIHASRRCRERSIPAWQVAVGMGEGKLVRERPSSRPHPSVVMEIELADGVKARAVWSWLSAVGKAKLVTVFFKDE